MTETADLNPTIVEALYDEALDLADEARAAFELPEGPSDRAQGEDLARIALSCEALRTTTRMMHAIAWLLNQRAYFAGELSEPQLARHGRLALRQAGPDPVHLALLSGDMRALIERTQRFYARIERLDRAKHDRHGAAPPVHRLRERLGRAVASF